MEIKFILLLTVAVVSAAQPSLKRASHLTFFKWVAHNNDLTLVPTGEQALPAMAVHEKSSSEEQSSEVTTELTQEPGDEEAKENSEEAKKILEFLRLKKNRRTSRRRCANGGCRRNGPNRLLKSLSNKFPKANIRVEEDDDKSKDVNLLELLNTGKTPSQVLMSADNVRENFCKTQAFAQTIQVPGCHPKTIINNFCYGQCNSFFIPNHSSSPFQTCGNCEATKTHKLKINLVCPGREKGVHLVHVEKVLSCACVSRPSDTPHAQ